MVKISKRATSLILTVAMLLSMLCFSGMSVSAATTAKTVETAAGTATYRVMVNTNAPYISGASSVIKYDTTKLTLTSAALTSDFAKLPNVVNTSVAGQIKWNVVGDVSYTANTDKAVLEVSFTATEDVTTENIASYITGSEFNLITNTAANSQSTASLITDGTGIVEEFGAAPVSTPDHAPFELRGVAGYKLQSLKLNSGETIQILLGNVMPATKLAAFQTQLEEIFWGTGFKVYQNNGTTAVTSGNIKAGYCVTSADGSEKIYVAVRGDFSSRGTKPGLILLPQAKKRVVNNTALNKAKSGSSLLACQYYAFSTCNAATDTRVNNLDLVALKRYIKTSKFEA